MRKLHQTRLHNPPITRGNCYPTVIACFMDLESPEDVIQIQELYDKVDYWEGDLLEWVNSRGWDLNDLDGHQNNGTFYLVSGVSPRNPNIHHVCIYQNGKLWHDPHPDGTGVLTEEYFQSLVRTSKVCFKCNKMKPLSEYYRHPQMGDGLLGKCKSCTKSDTKKQTEINISTPEGLEKERERHREKYHRLGYKEAQKEWNKGKPWKELSVYKGLRKKYYKDLPKGFELHHWNYQEYFITDIFILNIRDHKNLHNYLNLDLEKRIFYLSDRTYLDTKEKHKEFIESLGIKIHEYHN